MTDNQIYYLVDKQGNKTHVVVPIDIYQSFLKLKKIMNLNDHSASPDLYSFDVFGHSAKGYPTGKKRAPKFVVIKGSQCSLMCANSLPDNIKELREKLIDEGIISLDPEKDCFVFNEDYVFSSASTAAMFIAGSVRNGLDVWENPEGLSLKRSGYGIDRNKGRITNAREKVKRV